MKGGGKVGIRIASSVSRYDDRVIRGKDPQKDLVPREMHGEGSHAIFVENG